MDPVHAGERRAVASKSDSEVEAIEFVRFCHRRRAVGWPELYDEMCAVAGRGLYRGYGADDLAEIGIGFGLFQMPALAGLVARVVEEDHERRRRTAAALHPSSIAADTLPSSGGQGSRPGAVHAMARGDGPDVIEVAVPETGSIRIAVPAGA